MNVIDEYFKLIKQVYEYFNFVEDWVIYPLIDRRQYFWCVMPDDEIRYSENADALIAINAADESTETTDDEYSALGENVYSNLIHKQRFYEKWVYRAEKHTMIFVDTQEDGNKFFAVYANEKEIIKEIPTE